MARLERNEGRKKKGEKMLRVWKEKRKETAADLQGKESWLWKDGRTEGRWK